MDDELYAQLAGMHGLVRIKFGQTKLKFMFLAVGMTSGLHSTLAPVMVGEEYYITPHVRMAHKYKVDIQLFDCEYCTNTCEPYKAYMSMFEVQKNKADNEIKKALDIIDARAKGKVAVGPSDKETMKPSTRKPSTESRATYSLMFYVGVTIWPLTGSRRWSLRAVMA